MPWSCDRRRRPRRSVRPAPGRVDVVAAVGAELHRVVEEVDDDLAEPSLVAADRRQAVRDVDDEPQALPLGEEPEPLGGLGGDPAEVDVVEQHERPAALDPGEVEQLVDHLDEMAGLDLDLRRSGRASSAAPPSPAASASRASVSASRLIVESGVRSSCDRLSTNSARICWRRRSSDTSSRTTQTPLTGERRARIDERSGRPRPLSRNSPDAPPVSRAVATSSSTRASTNASSAVRPTSEPGGRRRRRCAAAFASSTRAVVVEPDDADAHEVGEVRRRCGPAGRARTRDAASRSRSRRARRRADRHRVASVGPVPSGAAPQQRRAGRVELSLPVEGDADRDRQHDRRAARRTRRRSSPSGREHRTADRGRGTLSPSPTAGRTTRRRRAAPGPTARRRPHRPALGPGGSTVRLRLIPRDERFFDLFVEDAANVLGARPPARGDAPDLRPAGGPGRRDPGDEHRGDEISHDDRPPARGDVRHAVRPRGHPRPDQRPRRRPRLHRGGRRHVRPVPDRGADRDRRPAGVDHRQAGRAAPRGARPISQGFKGLDRYWIEVHRLENEGDQIARAAIAGPLRRRTDPIEVIKWKDIYGLLEETIDKAEDVANIIERITIKHA